MEYAIYLAKRTLRNKQRHALEDYEIVRNITITVTMEMQAFIIEMSWKATKIVIVKF